jgi:DNA-binding SARP family transcriptional activator
MLSFRILGPVEVLRDGRPLPLGSAKQRALLVCLLIRRGQTVPAGQLVDDLWAEEPPPSAEHQIHVYVSRLRKILDEDGLRPLVTRAPGYALEIGDADEVDAEVFERALRDARGRSADRPADALGALDGALRLWRGPSLADLRSEPFAGPVATRLEELRAVAEEERIGALLALGRHGETIPELEAVVDRYPLRERLRELQMLALYRSGRQAEALSAFETARRTLAEELGIDPSPTLRALEGAILRHDEELAAPPPAPVEAVAEPRAAGAAEPDVPSDAPRPARPSRRLKVPAVIAVAAVVAGAAALLRLPERTDRSSRTSSASASASARPGVTLHGLTWYAVPGMPPPPADTNQIVLGAAHTPRGYVACGITLPLGLGTLPTDAAIWTSTNAAVAWQPVPGLGAAGKQRAVDVVAFRGRVVVVGSDDAGSGFRPAVWVSNAALMRWERVNERSPSFTLVHTEATDAQIRGVAVDAAAGRAVAVGSISYAEDDDAAVWTSADGQQWTLSTTGGLAGPADTVMTDVVALHGGALVTVGSTTSPGGEEDASAWYSLDGGSTWRRSSLTSLGGPGRQQMNAVVAHGGEVVAVGEETIGDDTNAVVWTSADGGSTWTRVRRPRALGGPDEQRMFTAAWSPGVGIVAAGDEVLAGGSNAVVWTSPDGASWHRVGVTIRTSSLTGPGEQTVKVVIDTPTGFLALGAEGLPGSEAAAAWITR